ncbi:MAG: RluA family pseudouridine synthase [Candidatus Gracilibacteria bacterium]|nr:RluA family pseudouridine synthase [Candidatus Gracilibacteria bacterium]
MKLFKIEENDANQRLDKFLKKLFPNATRSLIYKINRKDKVKVKSLPLLGGDLEGASKFKKRDNEYKLQVGDEVKIFLSDSEFKELSTFKESTQSVSTNEIEISTRARLDKKDIVFEDSDLLVVNKNPGINVHPGDHKTKESNLIAQIQDYLGDKLNSLTFKPSLIHRIDRDTSGILMIGKKKDMLTRMVADLKDHKKVQKIYYAIVLGRLSRKEGTIKKNLLRIENAKDEAKVRVDDKGQSAVTHYKLIKEHIVKAPEGDIILSELEVQIETGRMHQIRVHLASIGNPIVGDKAYGDKRLNGFFAKNYGLTRQALHAWKIDFFHYGRDKNMQLTAKIKDDLVDFIKKVKNG